MACCGQSSGGSLTMTQRDIDDGLTLQVEYQGGRTVAVQGLVTGKRYTFSGLARLGDVDPRDAPSILRDRQFRLKGIRKPGPANG